MLAWSELLEHKQQELLHGFQRNIQAKLALCPLQKNDLLVIQLLLHQPVIVLEMLQNKLGISRRESSESLLRLTAVGILTEYKTRQNERQRIFVCMPVVELINKLDENLFLDK
jgi:predicted DNA-binding transcriptional regulator